MAVLGDYQKLTKLVGSPWGTGANGSATISSDPNTRATVTGTATQTTSTLGSAILSNGDIVMLHQTQGTGVGQWEFKVVASGGGTTSITWTKALQYTYVTGAQIIKIPQYTTATVSAHSVTAWNGTTGGVEVICAKTSITVSGALNGVGLGYRGGAGANGATSGGEGASGYGVTAGGAAGSVNSCGGPGGGYGGAGNAAGSGGTPGAVYGVADLTTVTPGGSGGGASSGSAPQANGGGSGSLVILISKAITVSTTIPLNGANGQDHGSSDRGGGGGSGGTVV